MQSKGKEMRKKKVLRGMINIQSKNFNRMVEKWKSFLRLILNLVT